MLSAPALTALIVLCAAVALWFAYREGLFGDKGAKLAPAAPPAARSKDAPAAEPVSGSPPPAEIPPKAPSGAPEGSAPPKGRTVQFADKA